MSKYRRTKRTKPQRRQRRFRAEQTPRRPLRFECLEGRRLLASDLNAAPTLAAIGDVFIEEDAPLQTVNLQGITAGAGEDQPLRVTATSDNEALVADLTVNYNSPATTGTLSFAPIPNQDGSVTLTVRVEDGGVDGDLETLVDNGVTAREFIVTVAATNDLPTLDPIPRVPDLSLGSGEQTIVLTGISAGSGEFQPLQVIADSDNESIIGTPHVDYTSPHANAILRYEPTGNEVGTVTVTVSVIDGGLDNDLTTTADNGVVQQQVVINVSDTPWTNPTVVNGERQIWDVNDSGTITLLDALLVIQISNLFPQYGVTGLPPAPADLNQDGTPDPTPGRGLYPDVDGDNKVTLKDALEIVNKINKQQNPPPGNPEGEASESLAPLGSPLTRVSSVAGYPTNDAPADSKMAPATLGDEARCPAVDAARPVSDEILWNEVRLTSWALPRDLPIDDLAADLAQHNSDESPIDVVLCVLAEADWWDRRA